MNTLAFTDDYEDADELSDLPGSAISGSAANATLSERIIRRRSSKACDQCRKSKCKCERALDGGPCKSCIMLGTPCTFLGPSRKRGPPKGYIDAIEARLHQTEALLGVLLAVEAERANESTPGAPEILNRVDSSPYGVKGRKSGNIKVRSHPNAQEISGSGIDLHSTHPSNDWQDRVATLLASSLQPSAHSRAIRPSAPSTTISNTISLNDPHPPRHLQSQHSSIHSSDHVRRQRRRVDDDKGDGRGSSPKGVTLTRNGSPSPGFSPVRTNTSHASGGGYASGYMGTSTDSDSEDDFVDAVGQLSLNEDEQVRYHGKASGLYLLGINTKEEARNEGGIWRFPKARVWPPLPENASTSPSTPVGPFSGNNVPTNPAMQEHLLEIYFTYVHAAFPVIHKDAFWEGYRSMQNPSTDTPSPSSDRAQGGAGSSPVPIQSKRRHVSPLLLLSMFAIAARYSPSSSPPHSPRCSTPTSPYPLKSTPMWTAGDDFLLLAKNLLDNTYASSMPSTVQSLLLLAYREIGIGAMAQAWVYTGMAVRMAQDLGMHRAADGWARVGMGQLFGPRELQERRRIWWGCIVLDSYVSTYIGRPLAIFEWDYDTLLPSVEESDEQEPWTPHPSLPPDTRRHGYRPGTEVMQPVPGRILSCFNASATLSAILSKIVQSIYSIRTTTSRHADSIHIEGLLDKWYFNLPEPLRFEMRYDSMGNLSTGSGRMPLPHVLTLHMKYWCTTLLLHRPFKSENGDDADTPAVSKKNYELCVGAANHITSIVTLYREKYCLQRAPVFLIFYVFTAAIMHVTSLSVCPDDPQARMGLAKCMDALQDMDAVWPAALRAHELLSGCDPLNKDASKHLQFGQLVTRQNGQERQKRAAEHAADSEDAYQRSQMHLPSSGGNSLAASQSYAQPWRSTQFTPISQETGPGQPGDFSPTTSLQASQPSYYWPSDGASYVAFPGTLSTSVLPQMYSTGLIDERRLPHLTSSQHGQTRGGRYPQFWNDYTSFPQMGMAYGQSPGAPTQGQEGMFLNGQYGGIYGA
ncbi:fungal-specific transcription factor domain-containing protein [Boletus edulis BED1]|uniref:Fungal-specific transcription factor domain-containing protein n=1 Tax=Boletus edulis BED1 TaxID=1328754 RepID=A0AAD4C8P7_BOLED|nr:fungal-specific transcription factor domain-containing protein [Boletus edulis BED1]